MRGNGKVMGKIGVEASEKRKIFLLKKEKPCGIIVSNMIGVYKVFDKIIYECSRLNS